MLLLLDVIRQRHQQLGKHFQLVYADLIHIIASGVYYYRLFLVVALLGVRGLFIGVYCVGYVYKYVCSHVCMHVCMKA